MSEFEFRTKSCMSEFEFRKIAEIYIFPEILSEIFQYLKKSCPKIFVRKFNCLKFLSPNFLVINVGVLELPSANMTLCTT